MFFYLYFDFFTQVDCLVCSYCFRFIGSVELQIGRKLYLQSLGLSVKHECADSEEDESMDLDITNNRKNAIPEGVLTSLLNGKLKFPYSDQFSLPAVISCPGGCGEEHYCRLESSYPCHHIH